MRRCDPPYFTENGAALPARLVNVLFDVVTLGEVFSAVMGLWVHTRGSNNLFCPHKFAEGHGMGELHSNLPRLSRSAVQGDDEGALGVCERDPVVKTNFYLRLRLVFGWRGGTRPRIGWRPYGRPLRQYSMSIRLVCVYRSDVSSA